MSADRESGGHARAATLGQKVIAALWIDDLHVMADNRV